MYKLDIGHEFHCMQTPTYNHKVEILTKALVYLSAENHCVSLVLRGLNRAMPKVSFLDLFRLILFLFAFCIDKDI